MENDPYPDECTGSPLSVCGCWFRSTTMLTVPIWLDLLEEGVMNLFQRKHEVFLATLKLLLFLVHYPFIFH